MNYAAIKTVDVANGPGVRVSLFVSGCRHHCKNCFNPEAWDFEYGEPFTSEVEDRVIGYLAPSYIEGITFLGGEPMEPENQKGILPLTRRIREEYPCKSIWCFTGFDFEKDILGKMWVSPVTRELVPLFDVMVDGKFIEEKKNLSLRFRGSENQRILDVKTSLAQGKAVWRDEFRS